MPFKISRTSIVRLRPPCLAGGIMGSTIAHHDEGGRGSEKIPLRSSCSRTVSHTKCATWSSISQMAWVWQSGATNRPHGCTNTAAALPSCQHSTLELEDFYPDAGA